MWSLHVLPVSRWYSRYPHKETCSNAYPTDSTPGISPSVWVTKTYFLYPKNRLILASDVNVINLILIHNQSTHAHTHTRTHARTHTIQHQLPLPKSSSESRLATHTTQSEPNITLWHCLSVGRSTNIYLYCLCIHPSIHPSIHP